jgi:GrpB-like predicted nucleotidyltransferase (UPF0157 family)
MIKRLDEMTDEELWQLFPIVLSEYQPIWKDRYYEEKKVIFEAIGTHNIVRIHHIGSTAVPGLLAKPTIDILVEIEDATDTSSLISAMQECGYRYLKQPENPPPKMMFIKGYTPEGFAGQVFHVHVRYQGDWDEIRFRDYLIDHPDVARKYGELKKRLKDLHEHDRDAYTSGKTKFIRRVCELSRKGLKNSQDS